MPPRGRRGAPRGRFLVPREEFEQLVADAIDGLPDELLQEIRNVAIVVEDEPPPGQNLLGLYVGVPQTERSAGYTFALPDRIEIYRLPILRICGTAEDVVEQVQTTVVHEIAHHFGISDARLIQLGWA